MRLTAREIVNHWVVSDVSIPNIERVLEIPQGELKLLYETEGPALPEMEVLLNMINTFPMLLEVAENNYEQ